MINGRMLDIFGIIFLIEHKKICMPGRKVIEISPHLIKRPDFILTLECRIRHRDYGLHDQGSIRDVEDFVFL